MARTRTSIARGLVGMVMAGLLLPACRSGAPREPAPRPAPEETQVGYGSQPRERVTGAVSSVDQDEVERRSAMRLDELLDNIPGVVVTRSAGSFRVRIRGAGTALGDGDPLFVVDGVPVSAETALAGVSPGDVKRIEVLKDAGSTAIYGSRGGNGVILITTRRQ